MDADMFFEGCRDKGFFFFFFFFFFFLLWPIQGLYTMGL